MTTYDNGLLARIAIRSLYKLFKRDFCGFPHLSFGGRISVLFLVIAYLLLYQIHCECNTYI